MEYSYRDAIRDIWNEMSFWRKVGLVAELGAYILALTLNFVLFFSA